MAVRGAGLASARSHWIFWTLAVVVFVVAIDEVLSLRGARFGGGFRSSSSRYSVRTSSGVRYTASSTRVRVRYGSQRPWRSWRSYGSSGYIYGYVYFTRRHYHYSNSDREPTICRNEYDNFMDNGTNYEWFICPNISNPDNYDSCCGDEDRQHCCKSSLDGARVFGIIVGLILFCLCAILLVYCCCCRKPDGRQTMFQKRFTSKHEPPPVRNVRPNVNGTSGNTAELTHLVNAPVNGPIANYPQTDQPAYPPMPLGPQPAYPPQPVPGYQSGCYPPVDPGMYPPPCPPLSSDLPYAVQPGVMDPAMGYPPNPSAASAPYLPEGAPAPPYPSGAAPAPPYPPGGAPAPLYPPGGAPAPPYPPGGAPAPPYPPGGTSAPPYPPYPPNDGAAPPYPPYPTDGSAFPHPRDGISTNYPSSPPPSYSSMK